MVGRWEEEGKLPSGPGTTPGDPVLVWNSPDGSLEVFDSGLSVVIAVVGWSVDCGAVVVVVAGGGNVVGGNVVGVGCNVIGVAVDGGGICPPIGVDEGNSVDPTGERAADGVKDGNEEATTDGDNDTSSTTGAAVVGNSPRGDRVGSGLTGAGVSLMGDRVGSGLTGAGVSLMGDRVGLGLTGAGLMVGMGVGMGV